MGNKVGHIIIIDKIRFEVMVRISLWTQMCLFRRKLPYSAGQHGMSAKKRGRTAK